MKLVWDEIKRDSNLMKHGLDFNNLSEQNFISSVVQTAKQGRYKALMKFDEKVISVIFSRLGTEAISIISMRLANKREVSDFNEK